MAHARDQVGELENIPPASGFLSYDLDDSITSWYIRFSLIVRLLLSYHILFYSASGEGKYKVFPPPNNGRKSRQRKVLNHIKVWNFRHNGLIFVGKVFRRQPGPEALQRSR